MRGWQGLWTGIARPALGQKGGSEWGKWLDSKIHRGGRASDNRMSKSQRTGAGVMPYSNRGQAIY